MHTETAVPDAATTGPENEFELPEILSGVYLQASVVESWLSLKPGTFQRITEDSRGRRKLEDRSVSGVEAQVRIRRDRRGLPVPEHFDPESSAWPCQDCQL